MITELLCTKCKELKSLDEFYPDKKCRARGGYQYHCKDCIKRKRQQHYDANREEVIARVTEYAKNHPEVAHRHGKKQREIQTKEEKHAWAKLNRELQAGRITRPDRCERCRKRRKLHGHHIKGYAPEHALDVLWVCVRCHHELHGRGPNCRK